MHGDVRFTSLISALLALVSLANSFYIPGYSIKSYRDGETLPLYWNKIYSDQTQLQYAYSELPFVCPPSGRKRLSGLTSGTSLSLNLGQVLRGDRIMVSDYELAMGEDQEIRYLCSHQVDAKGLRWARQLISERHDAEWIVDNLPGATSFVTTDKSRKYYAAGFKLGYEEFDRYTMEPRYYINNHVTIVIRYHRAPGKAGDKGKKVVVGFETYPKSIEAGNRDPASGLPADINNVEQGMELSFRANASYVSGNHTYSDPTATLTEDEDELEGDGTLTIPYTYSVYFREEEHLEWQNRWDMYFVDQDDNTKIHWLAILNSLIISGLLTAVVAVILMRTIRGDIKGYNKEPGMEEGKILMKRKGPKSPTRSPRKSMEKMSSGLLEQMDTELDMDTSSDDESIEEITGWKLVHGDVFRTPPQGAFLAPIVGSGTQVVFVAVGLLILSLIGVLNPSFRGGYISVGMGLFVFAGLFSGYFSARVYKTFGGQKWQKNVIVTGTLVPGLIFAAIFILNFFVWAQASSTAIPFGTLMGLIALWLLIQLPLVYVGSWYGFVMVGAWEHPVKPTVIPRQIPVQSWYMKSALQTILVAGLIPFAVVFIELLFVFKSIWLDKSGYYYVFGFLAVVCGILIITVIEVTVVATYIQLCSENYHWWWHSFFVGGASSVWIFAYCVWYYVFKLHVTGFVSSILFFTYSFLACTVYGLLTGTIGFLAAYAFVRRIYGAVKVD
ncbi:multispanning membrane protein [Venturia nashicola]|nr:multispanning membrane protein [Venturia nashicola]